MKVRNASGSASFSSSASYATGSACPAVLAPSSPASVSETKRLSANAPALLPLIAPAYWEYPVMDTSDTQPETVLPLPVTLSVTPVPVMPPT